MVIDTFNAVKSYTAVAQASQQTERTRETREEARLAATQRGNEATQVTLSREARQAQATDQLPQRERVNGNEGTNATRESESAAVARERAPLNQQPRPTDGNTTRQALTAYREASMV